YEPTFHDASQGFRPGRGCHTAIKAAEKYLEGGHDWVIDIDLENYIGTVNHQRLINVYTRGWIGFFDKRIARTAFSAGCSGARQNNMACTCKDTPHCGGGPCCAYWRKSEVAFECSQKPRRLDSGQNRAISTHSSNAH